MAKPTASMSTCMKCIDQADECDDDSENGSGR
jgi:hypothetical protein